MKTKFLSLLFITLVIIYSCKKDFPRQAAVLTESMDKPTAMAGGKVIDLGQTAITNHGFCWDITGYPTVDAHKITLGQLGQTRNFTGKIPGLSPKTVYYLKAWVSSENVVVYGDLISFITPDLPSVILLQPCEISDTSAKCSIEVTADGGAPIVTRGVCWNTSQTPDTNNFVFRDSIHATGVFNYSIKGLKSGTKYYTRAFAKNIYGIRYSEESSYTTALSATIPVLTTAEVSNVAVTSVTSGGNVTSDGGSNVTVRGVCWHTSPYPTIDLNKTSDGNGTGIFASSVTGLIANTTYYLRSYATNSIGTAYGEEMIFTTLPNPVIPIVITTSISNVTATSAISGGTVLTDGGSGVTARGVCWSAVPNPTTSNNHTVDGVGGGSYLSYIISLVGNTTYYVRGYATNSVGTAYGNELSLTTLVPFVCGNSLTVHHVVGNVAPVTKTVTYGTITNIPGEVTKCWITSNLGADHQAAAVNDATEASAGWYWQFNSKQGYKHDGTTRTPNTAWITNINENYDWQTTNDPCTIELGNGWRLPTKVEWVNIDVTGNWSNWNGPWNSGLKLHAAGYFGDIGGGNLANRGVWGIYWSVDQENTTMGWGLDFYDGRSQINNFGKPLGSPLRCIRD
ncbi:MAG: hypothetical protein WCJ26_11690 [bacterium]